MKNTPYTPYEPDELLGNIYEAAHAEFIFKDTLLKNLSPTEDQYEDEKLIGGGALKEVYKCYDKRSRRCVALARLKPYLGEEFFGTFIHEGWLTASLNHPNIIKIHDLNVKDGRPYFTMDLKGNTTLKDGVKKGAPLKECLENFLKICDAVSYAHSKKVIHLDLKPENIQCDDYGEVLVCDWGLAKFLDPQAGLDELCENHLYTAHFQTLYGEIKGSPGYMAPEQVSPSGEVSPLTDVYALGCILHFILTGSPPFTGKVDEVLKATEKGEITSPRITHSSIPKGLNAVTLKALEKEPEARYQSVQELRDEISRYLQGLSTRAEKPSLSRKALLYVKRHPGRLKIALAAILLLCAVSALYLRSSRQLHQRAETLSTENQVLDLSNQRNRGDLALQSAILNYKLTDPYYQQNPDKLLLEIQFLLNKEETMLGGKEIKRALLSEMNFIQLNFKEMLELDLPASAYTVQKYRKLAEQFPDFNFGRDHRPSVSQLTQFFHTAQEQGIFQSRAMISVMHYDWLTREHNESYIPVLMAMLKHYNRNHDIKIRYDEASSSLLLASPQKISSTFPKINFHLFSYLEVKTLQLKSPDNFDLYDLNGATITHLDLSELASTFTSRPLIIHGLKSLKVNSKALSDVFYRERVLSDTPYQIIREKEGRSKKK